MAKRILLVDDEPLIVKGLKYTLEQEGFETDSAADGDEALTKFFAGHYDFILLDVMLPKVDGITVCQRIREHSNVPIIMLTAKGEQIDKILGLEYGADDYMTKPFSPAELTARIDALYRRIGSDTQSDSVELTQGPFVLNTRNRTLDKEGKRIKLTQVEYAIMKLFMQNPGRALSREDILTTVWGRDYDGELKIVDVNIRRLRIKIEDDTANPVYITTVWGFGYKWGF